MSDDTINSEEDIRKTIKEMAALAITSNRLSEIHEKNLKFYPFIFFNGIQNVKIEYDLSYKSNVELDIKNNITIKSPNKKFYINYYLSIDDSSNDNLEKRFAALENAAKSLFWNDLFVSIFINDVKMYESKNVKR